MLTKFHIILFVNLLLLIIQIDLASLSTRNGQDKLSKTFSKEINEIKKEIDDWLTKVLPLDQCKIDINQPPKEVVECSNKQNLLNGSSQVFECCYKWGIVQCWFDYVNSNCYQYYNETIAKAEMNKSGMKNCESDQFGYGMVCLSSIPVWTVVLIIVGSLVVFAIIVIVITILICCCCGFFCTRLSCLSCVKCITCCCQNCNL